jgi:N6-adenosine-specific RNA methylase IME4
MKLVPAGGTQAHLFDLRPIHLDGWELRHNAAVPVGRPTYDQTAFALDFTTNIEEISAYWVGDIAAYAEGRSDWQEQVSQIIDVTGYEPKTIANLASLARRVGQETRALAPSVEHAKIVQKLPAKEQQAWMRKARSEGWGKRELDLELKASQKRGILTGTAELEGMFRVWLVDCPWSYGNRPPSKVKADAHYPCMTIDELCAMGSSVKAHTMKDAVMFFWVTAPILFENPGPREILEAWGFEPKTGMVWDKVDHNFGSYVSIRHEHLIIATRGSCTPDRPVPMFDSVFVERKSDVHSQKPALVHAMIERLYDGPRVELFAREPRESWTTWGNSINAPVQRAG